MHGGFAQKPSTSASTWYGVQHATNAPKINEIVRNALRARFSDFDFCRPPHNGFFLRTLSRLPIERMKSRFVDADGSFSLPLFACDMADVVDGVIFDLCASTVDICASAVDFVAMLLSVLDESRSSFDRPVAVAAASFKLDFRMPVVHTIDVIGRSGRSITLTVVLNLLTVSPERCEMVATVQMAFG